MLNVHNRIIGGLMNKYMLTLTLTKSSSNIETAGVLVGSIGLTLNDALMLPPDKAVNFMVTAEQLGDFLFINRELADWRWSATRVTEPVVYRDCTNL
jgi:hypothetical protein